MNLLQKIVLTSGIAVTLGAGCINCVIRGIELQRTPIVKGYNDVENSLSKLTQKVFRERCFDSPELTLHYHSPEIDETLKIINSSWSKLNEEEEHYNSKIKELYDNIKSEKDRLKKEKSKMKKILERLLIPLGVCSVITGGYLTYSFYNDLKEAVREISSQNLKYEKAITGIIPSSIIMGAGVGLFSFGLLSRRLRK